MADTIGGLKQVPRMNSLLCVEDCGGFLMRRPDKEEHAGERVYQCELCKLWVVDGAPGGDG